jgi:diguanylate cyclase (GGDEF)-like protein
MERNSIRADAKLLKENHLTNKLIEIVAGEREGTAEEQDKLRQITGKCPERIYAEAVYMLTHKHIEDAQEAQALFEDILRHRSELSRSLSRMISVEVAALDFLQNIRNVLKNPTIIEADQYHAFAYKAMVDQTTMTFDRDLLDADLDAEIEKAKRFGTVFSILFLDLDDLKEINDTYGHEAGNVALRRVSECARRNLRKYDSIYRYGGDEFVVLLPSTDTDRASTISYRILDLLQKVAAEEPPRRIGASIGIASFGNNRIKSRRELLEAADKALYQAKRSGKNIAFMYDDDLLKRLLPALPPATKPLQKKKTEELLMMNGLMRSAKGKTRPHMTISSRFGTPVRGTAEFGRRKQNFRAKPAR